MATYTELNNESLDGNLYIKVKVACFIAASAVTAESSTTANHSNRMLWAKQVYESPDREATRMLWAVLAANSGAALSAIQAATDAQVQTAVSSNIDVFANGTP